MAFAGQSVRVSEEFLNLSAAAIRDCFFPEYEFRSLVFLMGLLTNQLAWYKVKTMQILCVFIADIDMRKPEIASHGPDLISPLLRLLQTEFCPEALEVLDHIMAMPGTPMDKHHIRMSMASSQSRAIRKEYERTQSLFGIPEPTGWSIPMPAVHSGTTRSNVHAVFYTCANAGVADPGNVPTPEVEFRPDEIHFGYPFPPTDRTGTMMSDEVRGDGNMGELVNQLDSLDDFFDDNIAESPTSGGPRSPDHFTSPYYSALDAADPGARYDQQTLPLLRRSLKRNASITSFKGGFADSRNSSVSHPRDPAPMSPTAFAVPPVPPMRPNLQSRSVTSPAANHAHAFPGDGSHPYDTDTDEIFSEDESRNNSVSTTMDQPGADRTDPAFSLGNMIRPLAQGTRSSMRRLTGGGTAAKIEKDRFREVYRGTDPIKTAKSPKVPKVPATYLQSPPMPASEPL
jgi:hypothetical protein